MHSRHIDDSAGGSGAHAATAQARTSYVFPSSSGLGEALRLQIEHRPVAPAERHQFVVRAELDDAAVFEHADAIGLANR